MKYQIVDYEWTVDHDLAAIPVGTIIDTDQPEWAWLALHPPPINAMAIDQRAYDALRRRYPYWHIVRAPEIEVSSRLR